MRSIPVLTGQTCVGKTAYIENILTKYPIQVINLDSLQVYTFFRIGTGRYENIHTQHLSSFLSPEEQLSPESYVKKAISVVNEILSIKSIPLFEGGSTSYLRALLKAIPLHIFAIQPQDIEIMRRKFATRINKFIFDGLIQEVETGLSLGYENTFIMKTPIVYNPIVQYIRDKKTIEKAKMTMQQQFEAYFDLQGNFLATLPVTWLKIKQDKPFLKTIDAFNQY